MYVTNPPGDAHGDADNPLLLQDPAEARRYLERQRWPRGVQCPRCPGNGTCWSLAEGHGVRAGVWKCAACRRQFTVTVGTILAGGHLPLHVWLRAVRRLCEARTGVSTRDLAQGLGISYRSAWRLLQRIRRAMKWKPLHQALRKTRRLGRKEPLQPASLWPLEFGQAIAWLLAAPLPEPLELPENWPLPD